MARPIKSGIDYFPLDTDMEQDDKIALIEAKHGIIGFGVIIKIFKKIYGSNGYFYDWNEQTQLLFSKQIGIDFSKVIEIIEDAIKWELFDKKLWKTYGILTSRRIQKTYLEATGRRKEIDIIEEYVINGISEYKNKDNVNIYSKNADNSTQIKGKEKKGNKSKVNDVNNVFNFWNSKKIIVHKKLDEATGTKINAKLADYSLDEILDTIHNYDFVLKSPDYWFDYRWTLKDFLQRGFEKFKDKDVVHENYRRKGKDGKIDRG